MPVYLVHLDTPYKHAQHYIGWAKNVERRFAHHLDGTGANFLRVVGQAGISFRLVRVWSEGDKTFERQLKNRHSGRRLCPVCCGETPESPCENATDGDHNDAL